MSKGYQVILSTADDQLLLGPDEVQMPRIPLTQSQIDEWEFQTPDRPDLSDYRHGSAFIFFVDEDSEQQRLIQAGPVEVIESDDSTALSSVRGKDQLDHLDRDGPAAGRYLVEDETEGWRVIEDIWTEIDGWDAEVTEPEPEILDEGRVIQSGETGDFERIFGEAIDEFDPVIIDDDEDGPRRARTAWWLDPTDPDSGSWDDIVSGDEFVGGEAALFESGESNVVFTGINIEHAIEESDLRLAFRYKLPDGEHDEFTILFGGDEVETFPADSLLMEEEMTWSMDVFIQQDIEPGTYSVEWDAQVEDVGEMFIDAIVVYDVENGDTTFDNELHEPAGHLDRPKEYAAGRIVGDIESTSAGITEATLTTDSPTDGDQALALEFSPDGNESDFEADAEESNTNTLTASPDDPVGSLRGAITLGGVEDARDDASPRLGYEPQVLTEWELQVTLQQIVIISSGQEYTGTWYEILQSVHDDADMLFNAIPVDSDADEFEAESFSVGDKTDSVDWTRLGFSKTWDTSQYANQLTAVGDAGDADEDPPVVEVKSEEEIDRVGVVPAYDDSFGQSDSQSLENRATTELQRRIREDQLTGTVEIVPRLLKPGYEYHVPAFERDVVLQRLEFEDGTDPQGRLEFEERDELAAEFAALRR